MHAISHTLAHRAPPASRTRARWQPYNSLSTYTALSGPSSSKSSSPVSESTPATSVFSSSQPITACDSSAIQSALQNPTVTSTEPSKDATSSKNKLALGLVDQAVKTLCEVWRPQDIPPVFSNPRTTRQTQSLPNFSPQTQLLESNSRNRLPSKAQQTTTASTSIPTSHTIPAATATPALIQPCTSSELRNLVPIRGFVHEVLRRSRTSGCVLQTALCYLEAIRPKIAEYAHLERIGKGTNGEPETAPRIVVATQEEIERSRMEEEQELSMSESAPTTIRISGDDSQGDAMDTVRVEMDEDTYLVSPDESSMTQDRSSSSPLAMDSSSNIEETESTYNSSSTTSTSPSRPIGHLPTPLLCPRRAFLAALILASKFTQDKCYSNRAWAKLSGLPPKEIGRCERALGCALEWRLWVGKANAATSTPTQSSSSPTSAHRPVVRCQSESSLNMTVPTTSDLINPYPVGESSASMLETPIRGVALVESDRVSGPRRTIKRAATLPSNVMTAALNGSSVPNLCEISSPAYFDNSFVSERTSSTLGPSSSSIPPVVQLQITSPNFSTSTVCSSPSPDLPNLSYSPSSVSSSPSSTSTDRVLHMSGSFEDVGNSSDYLDSPVARINTKLLVPGYTGHANHPALGLHGFHLSVPRPKLGPVSPAPFGVDGFIAPQILVDQSGEYAHGFYGSGSESFRHGST